MRHKSRPDSYSKYIPDNAIPFATFRGPIKPESNEHRTVLVMIGPCENEIPVPGRPGILVAIRGSHMLQPIVAPCACHMREFFEQVAPRVLGDLLPTLRYFRKNEDGRWTRDTSTASRDADDVVAGALKLINSNPEEK